MEQIKKAYKCSLEHLKKAYRYSIVKIFTMALAINFIVECFGRKSILKGFVFIGKHPFVYLYGVLIIMTTLSIALLFRRRMFVYIFVSAIWLIASFINFVVLNVRVTPFNFADLLMIKDAIAIWHLYYSKFKMALIIIAILLVVIGLIYMWFKLPRIKESISYLNNAIIIAALALVLGVFTQMGVTAGKLDVNFANIASGYLKNGFAYSFSSTMFNSTIRKPSGYSSETINGIAQQLDKNNNSGEQMKPNIIFVQLESFFDPAQIKGVEMSKNPIPYFTELYNNYPHGYLSVPSVGAGTANTEVEVYLGMNMLDFGTGVYPYKTIFNKTVVESIAFNLKSIGYTAFAMHNNVGDFYSRNLVFANFGYDVYIPLECMTDVKYNDTKWAKDEVLVDYIKKCLNSTPGQDYITAISVQGHGAYPTNISNYEFDITVSNFRNQNSTNALTYYVNQIAEMDNFVKTLVTEVDKMDEDTVIVFYGDHLPNFELTEEELVNGDIFKTPYVMWNNFGMKNIEKDLEAYQLSAELLDRLNIHVGTLVKYHQNYANSDNYLENLRQLEYDMILGEHYIYNGDFPYKATDIVYGIDEVKISFPSQLDNGIAIYGNGFNEYSVVTINEEEYDVRYENHILFVDGYTLKTGDEIVVTQKNGQVTYRKSNKYIVK